MGRGMCQGPAPGALEDESLLWEWTSRRDKAAASLWEQRWGGDRTATLLYPPSNSLPVLPLLETNKRARDSGKCFCSWGRYLRAKRQTTYLGGVVFTVDLDTSFIRSTKISQFVYFPRVNNKSFIVR